MPRRTTTKDAPGRLTQGSITRFFEPSSPIQPQSDPSPKSSRTSRRTATAKVTKKRTADTQRTRYASEEDISEQADDDDASSDVGAIHFESEVISVSSEDDDVAASPKRPTMTQKKRGKCRADSEEIVQSRSESDVQEERIGVPVVWKGKAKSSKRKRPVVRSESEEEAQPRRRKLVKGVRPLTPEVDDLMDEIDQDKIVESRLRKRDKRSAFQKNLEKLKKKKRGELVQSESSESEIGSGEEAVPFSHARPHEDGESEASPDDEDPELDGFIEEDNNTVAPELPVQFSMNTFQELVHHFKIICQLFVHLAVHKRNNRRAFMEQSLTDDYFSVPLQIARRKITGMRDSLVTSSVWRPEFKKPLETYPDFETIQLDFALPSCDACHLGGRISTLLGRVSGDPYDKLTFQRLHDNDSSGDDEGGDSDDSGQQHVKEFHLGRFCAKRTRVFHRFTHWEYALFKALSQEVEDLQNRQSNKRMFVRVAYAGGKEPPDDLSDADGIMNWLDERGVIGMEWQKIKEMMETARNLEVAAKRGDED